MTAICEGCGQPLEEDAPGRPGRKKQYHDRNCFNRARLMNYRRAKRVSDNALRMDVGDLIEWLRWATDEDMESIRGLSQFCRKNVGEVTRLVREAMGQGEDEAAKKLALGLIARLLRG